MLKDSELKDFYRKYKSSTNKDEFIKIFAELNAMSVSAVHSAIAGLQKEESLKSECVSVVQTLIKDGKGLKYITDFLSKSPKYSGVSVSEVYSLALSSNGSSDKRRVYSDELKNSIKNGIVAGKSPLDMFNEINPPDMDMQSFRNLYNRLRKELKESGVEVKDLRCSKDSETKEEGTTSVATIKKRVSGAFLNKSKDLDDAEITDKEASQDKSKLRGSTEQAKAVVKKSVKEAVNEKVETVKKDAVVTEVVKEKAETDIPVKEITQERASGTISDKQIYRDMLELAESDKFILLEQQKYINNAIRLKDRQIAMLRKVLGGTE